MSELLFKRGSFVKTATQSKDYPMLRLQNGDLMPEVALVGRSNVGKSSLLNHLLQTNGLAKTSSTPGKTQAINFFIADREIAFADLPGYGYAKVPVDVRKQWGPMVQTYLEERLTLRLILFLLDIRRIPNQEDLQLLSWISRSNKGMILVLTKTDKLNQKERRLQTEEIFKTLAAANIHFVHYSTMRQEGRRELSRMLRDAIQDETSGEKE